MSTVPAGEAASVRSGISYLWPKARMGDVLTDAQAGFATGDRDPHGVLQLRMQNVDGIGRLDFSKPVRVPTTPAFARKYLLEPGDVVFNNTNSAKLVGKSAFISTLPEPLVFSNHFTRLRTRRDLLDPQFLALWLLARWQDGAFERLCDRWIGQAAVGRQRLLDLTIPLPPPSEQKRIAARLREQLNVAARMRVATDALATEVGLLTEAQVRKTFESPECSAAPTATIGDVTSLVIDGPHVTPSYVDHGVPFVTVRNIVNRVIDMTETRFITSEDHTRFASRGKAEVGDILYTKDGTLGIPCLVQDVCEFSFFVSVALIKLRQDIVDPEYVAYALDSPSVRSQVALLAAGAGLKHMVLKSIRALSIPLPPIETQQLLAAGLGDRLRRVHALASAIRKQEALIGKLPPSLLRGAFSGDSPDN